MEFNHNNLKYYLTTIDGDHIDYYNTKLEAIKDVVEVEVDDNSPTILIKEGCGKINGKLYHYTLIVGNEMYYIKSVVKVDEITWIELTTTEEKELIEGRTITIDDTSF